MPKTQRHEKCQGAGLAANGGQRYMEGIKEQRQMWQSIIKRASPVA